MSQWWEQMGLGIQVNRPVSIIPQTVVAPGTEYFTVAGGLVLVTGLVGIMTAPLSGAVNGQWCFEPTTGTRTNVTGATVLGGLQQGDILTVSGIATEGMLPVAGTVAQLMGGVTGSCRGLVLPPGALGVFTDASRGGNWIWILWYMPIDTGATVVAA